MIVFGAFLLWLKFNGSISKKGGSAAWPCADNSDSSWMINFQREIYHSVLCNCIQLSTLQSDVRVVFVN